MSEGKLKDLGSVNYARFPEIFDLTEQEVIDAVEAVQDYHSKKGYGRKGDDTRSYIDWAEMYVGIHREWESQKVMRGWLACMRWMKSKQVNQKTDI